MEPQHWIDWPLKKKKKEERNWIDKVLGHWAIDILCLFGFDM